MCAEDISVTYRKKYFRYPQAFVKLAQLGAMLIHIVCDQEPNDIDNKPKLITLFTCEKACLACGSDK